MHANTHTHTRHSTNGFCCMLCVRRQSIIYIIRTHTDTHTHWITNYAHVECHLMAHWIISHRRKYPKTAKNKQKNKYLQSTERRQVMKSLSTSGSSEPTALLMFLFHNYFFCIERSVSVEGFSEYFSTNTEKSGNNSKECAQHIL